MREMAMLREQGYSLDEVAARFAVSRERVRQILHVHGAPDPQVIAEGRRRRAQRLADERIDELLVLWRAGRGPGEIAARLGLQAATCRAAIERCATDIDRAARTASMAGRRVGATYSDEDIVRALRSAADRLGRTPSPREYAAIARPLAYPSLATVLNRSGGWLKAVASAGLRPRSTATRPRPRRWTEQACWDALRRAVDELGEIPGVVPYERLAVGRRDLPSAATIRNRLGRWSSIAARLAAQRELAEQARVRTRSAADALASA